MNRRPSAVPHGDVPAAIGASRPAGPAGRIGAAATQDVGRVLAALDVDPTRGLGTGEVAARARRYGPNAVSSHRARLLPVLWHQLRSPLLGLLLTAALASYLVGQRSDAVIIAVIVAMSVGLGFVNEYRAEKAAQALHAQISHQAVVLRDGQPRAVEVTALVPGDVVQLHLGEVVPADIRLTEVNGLECNESMMTGESQAVAKQTDPVAPQTALADLTSVALMGTIVRAGNGRGVVVATGVDTQFGAIASGLGEHQLETSFQVGLRRFSMLLVYVAGTLTSLIFVANLVLQRPFLDALLFSLAIAVGITPQLLPAVVATSLAAGSRRMLRRKVLVKRLVCIEDLGDIDTLFTDKTGTLTLGQITYARSVPTGEARSDDVLRAGLLCTESLTTDEATVGVNPLDQALADTPAVAHLLKGLASAEKLAVLPFDHDRRMVSVLLREATTTTLLTKGAPETVLDRCLDVPPAARAAMRREFEAGNRVVAVATRPASGDRLQVADETGLHLLGFLVFLDPPKPEAAAALRRLAGLGITVKVVTGDNPAVAAKVCHDLGLAGDAVLTGTDLDALSDSDLPAAVDATTVFARVSPEHKARIVRARRSTGSGVAFLGDGVNDALALHGADVGISVDSGTDVAKDAADVILLEKDLGVLADGVTEGRRIFANTIKYVLMGTSSNFGNMFSAAGASLFLPFLPMLPSQILLNNLLYDTSQLAIPTDNVDEEQLHRPSHWDLAFIRRFMMVFGPLSSLFDFATFAVMLGVFHAGSAEFRSGWFVESLATQTLVIFAIRTRRVPFFRSHPSLPLTLAALGVATFGALLPATPLARTLGFAPLPGAFFATLVAMVVGYLVLIEIAKSWFYRIAPISAAPARPVSPVAPSTHRQLRRRARRFSTHERLPHPRGTGASGPP
ncbi:magnesium-translocating P-type ATPase [Nocardioides sp.]|uniref:magnesium-translocating P-type ATPase n=1 Tax=Nocardioides sp. TaxID=35761 RepID=UPI003D098DC8